MFKAKKIFFIFVFGLFLFSGVVSAGFFSDSFNKIKWKITGYSATGCMDSDGGIEPFIFGYTYGSSAGGMIDHCLNSHFLKEAFCTSTGGISSTVIECEYGCNAGKCNTKEECESPEGCELNQNYCLDEDLGDYFEKGDLYLVRVGWYDNGSDLFSYKGSDSCRDSNWLAEYICQPTGKDARKFVACPDGCFDGACIKGEKYLEAQRANCIDSFQGPHGMERLFVKGTVSYDGKIYEDVCASKGILTEYSCDDFGLLKKANTGCVHGCEEGVCLKSPSNPEPSTSEKSGGSDNLGGEGDSDAEDSCENEGKCTYSGERYCEGNISFVCGHFDLDSCLDVKWSNCPGLCEDGVCVADNEEGNSNGDDGETKVTPEESNLIANNFRIINRDLEKVILLEFEEEGLLEGDEYFVSFSHSLDRGATFEEEVFIPRDLLEVEGFGVYSNAAYFESGGAVIVTIKADMNVPYLRSDLDGELRESNLEDNCIQQSFRISDSLLYRGEKDVVPLRDFKRCEREGVSNSASSSSDFSQDEGFFEEKCSGCFLEGNCYLFGEVLEDKYCSSTNSMFERRLEFGERCQEDYQCVSGFCEDGRCSKRTLLSISSCSNGCPLSGFCYETGSREDNLFCSNEGFFIPTKREGSSCNASYECSSNFCHREECISPNFFHRFLRELGMYPKI